MPNLEPFIAALYGDRGKPALTDPAELISTAAADAGVTAVPSTTTELQAAVTASTIPDALGRRGSVLFQMTGAGSPRAAVSLGNNAVIESRSPAFGVVETDSAAGQPWTHAGWLPGIEA
jgi:hypothetical protein